MNCRLPIAEKRAEIVAAVRNHSVVVITAETGAGKSTNPGFSDCHGSRGSSGPVVDADAEEAKD